MRQLDFEKLDVWKKVVAYLAKCINNWNLARTSGLKINYPEAHIQ